MPVTLSDIRTEVRRELKDEDASAYRWTNDEVDRHIRRALVEYSRASPRQMKTTKATTASSRNMDISAMTGIDDLIRLVAVEYPVDKTPRIFQRFSLWNNIITLIDESVPDGTNSYIYWESVHLLAASGTPSCTVPEKDQETLVAGAAGYAALAWAQNATNRANLAQVYHRVPKSNTKSGKYIVLWTLQFHYSLRLQGVGQEPQRTVNLQVERLRVSGLPQVYALPLIVGH